ESCAKAVMPSAIAIAEAMVREIRRTLRSLQFNFDSPLCRNWARRSAQQYARDAPTHFTVRLRLRKSYAVLTTPDTLLQGRPLLPRERADGVSQSPNRRERCF